MVGMLIEPSGPIRRMPVKFVLPRKVISRTSPADSKRTGGTILSSVIGRPLVVVQPAPTKTVRKANVQIRGSFCERQIDVMKATMGAIKAGAGGNSNSFS